MEELRVKSKQEERLIKVFMNEKDDFIIVNANDVTFVERFAGFITWLDKMQEDIEKIAEESRKEADNADSTDIEKMEKVVELSRRNVCIYKECISKLEAIFGKGSVHMFFDELYEANEDFVPDEECIIDFVDQMIPIMEKVYDARFKRIKKKYSSERKGKHSKSKDELIAEAKNRSGVNA